MLKARESTEDRKLRQTRTWVFWVLWGLGAIAAIFAFLADTSTIITHHLGMGPKPTLPLTPEVREHLIDEVRVAVRDGEFSELDRTRLEGVAFDLAIDGERLADLLRRTVPRLEEANQRMQVGVEHLRRRRFEAARSQLLAATLVDPDDSMAWTNLAEIDRLTGRLREAEEASRKALAQDPGSWIVQYNHGLLLAQIDQLDRSAEHIEKALLLVDDDHRSSLLEDLESNVALAPLREQGTLASLAGRSPAR